MKAARIWKIIGLLPVGLLGLIFLLFGVGETIEGGLASGGWAHLIELLILVAVMWLGWKRPLWGGILFLAAALLRGGPMLPMFFVHPSEFIFNSGIILLVLIPALSGCLLLWAAHLERLRRAGVKPASPTSTT